MKVVYQQMYMSVMMLLVEELMQNLHRVEMITIAIYIIHS